MPKRIVVLIGLPASGKTTHAKQLMEVERMIGNGFYRVNWDELRSELGYEGQFIRAREEEMKKESIRRVESAFSNGVEEIIIDNTNLTESTRAMWEGVAQRLGLLYEEVKFTTPLDVCIKRDAQRKDKARVGRAVIERMALWAKQVYFSPSFGLGLKNVVLLDIDGTIADLTHRKSKIFPPSSLSVCAGGEGWCESRQGPNKNKKDWYSFYQNVKEDAPIEPIIKLARLLRNAGYLICIVSGRPIQFKGLEVGKETENWLDRHDVPYDHLFMRQSNDSRKDTVVKQEILDKLPKDRIAYVLDDRDSVVSMWRQNGLTCLQVAPGDF